ncbi:MAG: hypothetical protein EBR99_03665 [Actinobacteria bacterium]|nr:hypothetical protein [Actinomycetota bacterium]
MAGNVDYIALRVARNAGGRVSPASASQADIIALQAAVASIVAQLAIIDDQITTLEDNATALTATVLDLNTHAYRYAGGFAGLTALSPGNIVQYYILEDVSVGVSQVWLWSFGNTTPDNGVTVLANNANNGRFLLQGTT